MKRILFILVIVGISMSSKAQDIHFSMFDQAPLVLNPALTGAFPADHRIIANYKNQWKSVANPYTTYALSYEYGFLKSSSAGFMAAGLQLYNDRAGDTKMGIFQANLSLAYHLALNTQNILTAGIQGGFSQRSINPDLLQWDDQYDPAAGGYSSSIITNDPLMVNGGLENFSYGDFATGLMYSFNNAATTMSSNNYFKLKVGLALLHLNRPKIKFSSITSKMYSKFNFHIHSMIGIKNTNLSLVPSAVLYFQGPSREINMGMLFRYRLRDASHFTNFVTETAISLGAHYRFGDAVIVEGMFEWKNFSLGLCYDINTSGLAVASNGAGGMEIALRFMTPLSGNKNKSLY